MRKGQRLTVLQILRLTGLELIVLASVLAHRLSISLLTWCDLRTVEICYGKDISRLILKRTVLLISLGATKESSCTKPEQS